MRLAFLSTLSLRRATFRGDHGHISGDISIHALLAESDPCYGRLHQGRDHFYPRSPCGERLYCHCLCTSYSKFLSTLSLRRATRQCRVLIFGDLDFYPRSPCGERRRHYPAVLCQTSISIHALLAESDVQRGPRPHQGRHFYPRSPCGERHGGRFLPKRGHRFLSTLSLRRATVLVCPPSVQPDYFYPRSPCGERPTVDCNLSRRLNFYPRSPCGERLTDVSYLSIDNSISIHALLAESDTKGTAERRYIKYFYPRSPCGERLLTRTTPTSYGAFLSTLSLRRATLPSIATYQGA